MMIFADGASSRLEADLFRCDAERMAEYRILKLRELTKFAHENSEFHRRRFAVAGFEPGDLKTLDDFEKLPIMTKSEVREYNEELNTVPVEKVREVFTTSGTTGDPVVYRYTADDLRLLADQGGDMIGMAGVEPGDLFQLTMPLGAAMWIAGLNFWLAFQKRGAGTVRFGPGDSMGQLRTALMLGVNGLFLTAGFAVRLGSVAEENGMMDRLRIRKLLVVNENILSEDLSRNDLGRRIENIWSGAGVRAVYGNTELGFSGAECEAHKGFHTHPASHYFEALRPETNLPLDDGVPGRLVVTSLLYMGLPLIRYAVDDVTFLMRDRCPCGISSDRFGPILGRLDDMIKVKGGVSIYPPAIDNILLSIPTVEDYYFEVYKDDAGRQNLRLHALPHRDAQPGEAERAVENAFSERFHFRPEVKTASREAISAKITVSGKRKPQRFHDLRGAKSE